MVPDLATDPGETVDVSNKHPEIVADLQRHMDAAMKELAENSREIGKVPGTPDTNAKRSNRDNSE